MKIDFKKAVVALIALSMIGTAQSAFAKDKTAGEKLDHAIEKTEKAAESTKDKAKEVAKDTKEKASEKAEKTKEWAHEHKEKAKEEAHKGIDKL